MTELTELIRLAESLPAPRLGILIEMARALHDIRVNVTAAPGSDIVTPDFADSFTARLVVYHSMHDEKMSKKTFEYMFQGACKASGRNAVINPNTVNAGADLMIDGVPFSLKTEASRDIRPTKIHISKFMEARWIRDCLDQNAFASEAAARVLKHLATYSRIVILRAFNIPGGGFKYDLYEIPLELLSRIGELLPQDYKPRTAGGSSSALVKVAGETAFRLQLDGSVEKITLTGLDLKFCQFHASWSVSH